jgi:hypothetical protein
MRIAASSAGDLAPPGAGRSIQYCERTACWLVRAMVDRQSIKVMIKP